MSHDQTLAVRAKRRAFFPSHHIEQHGSRDCFRTSLGGPVTELRRVAGVLAAVWRMDGDGHPYFNVDLKRATRLRTDECSMARLDHRGAGSEIGAKRRVKTDQREYPTGNGQISPESRGQERFDFLHKPNRPPYLRPKRFKVRFLIKAFIPQSLAGELRRGSHSFHEVFANNV